jgi:hypothetical protein
MRPEQRRVLKQFPQAKCWWNCMEFDWLIWNGPAMTQASRIIGSGLTKSEAWANAAKGIRTAESCTAAKGKE